ncbi:hypothetical protein [uncultured Tateyamaria sp.]|nr:hypothetical protein [uncultured Tateyamaria sp.]
MSNNKILTVSYGTFSCTLEGFDDSFGTMKAIAEYFRDLAADDRYFGAEPPQPDAEMLARIAEREISRRVEAREQEGRIVLSAEPEAAAPAAITVADVVADAPEVVAPEPQEAKTDQPEPAVQAQTAPEVEDVIVDAPVTDTEETVEDADTDAAFDMDSLSAALDASDEADATAEDEPTAALSDDATNDDLPKDAVTADATGDTDDLDALMADVDTDADETPDDSAEAFFADTTADVAEGENEDAAPAMIEAEEVVDTPEAPAPDSIAAKLQRIRAVVSQSKEDGLDDDMFEDEHAEAFAATDETDIDIPEDYPAEAEVGETLADARATFEAAADADDSVEAVTDEDADDEISDILARYDADTSDAADALAEAPQDVIEEDDAGIDSLAADLDIDTADSGAAENLFGADMDDDIDDEIEDEVAETDATDTPSPRRARIIKVKRADIDAALAQGHIEEIEDEEEATAVSSLSEEEEAELQAELAAVAAELPETDADDLSDLQQMDDASAVGSMAEDAQEMPVADADVSRLMAEADSQMEEPEGSRRRNAFQHLKAAVMAKKADAGIGDDTIKDEGAFRSDLASVVVPRRPAASGTRDARPAAERPAPLKLVAEQRVDLEGAAPSGPVRPRRIAQAEEPAAIDTADGSFADYAADMGAHSLPDLLEAAASYLSFVEGHDQFSRPQLMTKVRQVEKEDFSREDGLRSFGQLLRAGKIEKRKGGRFTVTSDIGYRPDERAAG